MVLIIFTDLDGTLLNQDDYRYDEALPVLKELKNRQILVIPVTSKTRAEVEGLRQEIGLSDPFIVENGSGIFVPFPDERFVISQLEIQGNYHRQLLGCNYIEAKQGLKNISGDLNIELKGFADLTAEELISLTGLSLKEAKLAKTRDFTEPFVTPKNISVDRLTDVINQRGFKVVLGDRFSHLIGVNAGKGKAVKWLLNCYQIPGNEKIFTIGLGNSPNDIEMLEVVDYPIIIPGKNGIHQGLKNKGWKVAPATGCLGWAEVIRKFLLFNN